MELKLQKTAEYLNQVYGDQQIQIWLNRLGLKIDFPKIFPIPEHINFTRITSDLIRKVVQRLVEEGQS